MKKYLTVDPGAKGGMVLRFGKPKAYTALAFSRCTEDGLLDWIRMAEIDDRTHVIIEQVGGYIAGNASPGSAMFKFGDKYGAIRGMLRAVGAQINLVTPQKWQKALGLKKPKLFGNPTPKQRSEVQRAWKNHLKDVAQKMFPAHGVTLDTADAFLLMRYMEINLP